MRLGAGGRHDLEFDAEVLGQQSARFRTSEPVAFIALSVVPEGRGTRDR